MIRIYRQIDHEEIYMVNNIIYSAIPDVFEIGLYLRYGYMENFGFGVWVMSKKI